MKKKKKEKLVKNRSRRNYKKLYLKLAEHAAETERKLRDESRQLAVDVGSLRRAMDRISRQLDARYAKGKSDPKLVKDLLHIIQADEQNGRVIDGVLVSYDNFKLEPSVHDKSETIKLGGYAVLRCRAVKPGFGIVVARKVYGEQAASPLLGKSFQISRSKPTDDEAAWTRIRGQGKQ